MQNVLLKPNKNTIIQAKELTNSVFNGKELLIKPYSYYKDYSWEVLRILMHFKGIYCLPTQELIDYLKEKIKDKDAIEIGAGVGAIGKTLEIPTTDSRLQEREDIKLTYTMTGQPTIEYPDHVEKLDAKQAVEKYKPEVVIGAYITEKWNDKKGIGNYWGVDEIDMFKKIQTYIHIGDKQSHSYKELMTVNHFEHTPEWLLIRGKNGFIGEWTNLNYNGR